MKFYNFLIDFSSNLYLFSLNQIKIVEEKLNGLIMANFNLDRSNTKIGTVFLEVFYYFIGVYPNMMSLEYGRDPVGI